MVLDENKIIMGWVMFINLFEKAINFDRINNMSKDELQQLDDIFTSKATKDAMALIKAENKPIDLHTTKTLMDALEIGMNSVGFTHFSASTYYDLIDLAQHLVEYYTDLGDDLKTEIAETLYYRCLDDLDDEWLPNRPLKKGCGYQPWFCGYFPINTGEKKPTITT